MKDDRVVWAGPNTPLQIGEREIHVWRMDLDLPDPLFLSLRETLTADESDRANRFYFEHLRKRYSTGRGALRSLISAYLGIAAPEVVFSYSEYGKPFLPGSDLFFNVSHSENFALFAFVRQQPVGIDIERIRPLEEGGRIARRFFSPHEADQYDAAPGDLKDRAFFNCWTRKEAYIKAVGEGLSHPLDQFEVTLLVGEPSRLVTVQNLPEEAGKWELFSITPAENYIGAVALRAKALKKYYWDANKLFDRLHAG